MLLKLTNSHRMYSELPVLPTAKMAFRNLSVEDVMYEDVFFLFWLTWRHCHIDTRPKRGLGCCARGYGQQFHPKPEIH